MKSIKTAFFISVLILINGCSSMKVNTDYNKGVNFKSLKTYQWITHVGTKKANGLMHNRIESAIEKQLNSQGFSMTSSNADFYINYSVTTEDKIEINSFNTYGGYAGGWGWGRGFGYSGMAYIPGHSQTVVDEYKTGTLIIDVIANKNNQLIWRGMGSKKLPDRFDTTKLDELVNKAVGTILENFPPQ